MSTADEAIALHGAWALARVLEVMHLPVDHDLPGDQWCEECGVRTNHREHGES